MVITLTRHYSSFADRRWYSVGNNEHEGNAAAADYLLPPGYSYDAVAGMIYDDAGNGCVITLDVHHSGLPIAVTNVDGREAILQPAPAVEVMPPAPWEALPEGDYAIVELMGYQTLVGRIAEVERFGAKMAAIEAIFCGQLLPAVFQGGPSIYRLTPCTREVAWESQHLEERQLPEALKAIVPAALLPATFAAQYGADDPIWLGTDREEV